MFRTLTVTTPATDLQLLTIEQMRQEAGVNGSSQDSRLATMGLRNAAAICTECNIAIGIGAPPTLRRETLTETIRGITGHTVVLGRRHEIAITSVVEDETTLEVSEYVIDPESGLLMRLCGDYPTSWSSRPVTVVYNAGFAPVPGELEDAAAEFLRLRWREKDRDPSVKGFEKDIPGVMRERTDYWAGSIPGQGGEGPVPDLVAGQLARFRNPAHG